MKIFVAGGTGFIGHAFVAAAARHHDVSVLTRSLRAEHAIAALGARPVRGDLLARGAWQREAARAACVVHLAQPRAFGGRVSVARADEWRAARLTMDEHLFDAIARGGECGRVVYVAGTSYYGDLGSEPRDESATPRPRGWGPFLAPAVDALDRWRERGLPIVTAFPGHVYGCGSWFHEYVLEPLLHDKRIHVIAGAGGIASPVHVRDCASALLHLALNGVLGERYFVVDDEPLPWRTFYERAARVLGRRLRLREVPRLLMRALAGDVVTESLSSNAVLSNAKLKSTGFELAFPTSLEGIAECSRGSSC